MVRGGDHERPVTAADLLPTAEAIALAKGFAARACAEKAVDVLWADLEEGKNWLGRARYVALSVLIRLCPEVEPARLSLCLGLDVHQGLGRLHALENAGRWSPELIETICRQVLGREPEVGA